MEEPRDQTSSQDLAGAGETTSDRTGRAGETGQTGTAGQQDTMGGQMGTTEFAALDTNSDGRLGQTEWQPEVAGGREFQEIDEDSSGDIDREEFRQALATTGSGQGSQGSMQNQDSDMNTLDDPSNQ